MKFYSFMALFGFSSRQYEMLMSAVYLSMQLHALQIALHCQFLGSTR